MTDTRIIKLPTWEECMNTPQDEDTPLTEIVFRFGAFDSGRETLAAALNEAAKVGAEAAKEGQEVRYEP
jgi:hypothetical protein